MRRLKKTFNITITAITGLLLVFTLMILIIGIKATKENKMPQILGYTYSTVSTPSMVPIIEVGDIIITKAIAFEDIIINDIVVFYSQSESKYIVHRVIEINDEGELITKGDANLSKDNDPVIKENYVGKVIKIIPRVGSLVLNYRNLLFIVIIIIFIYIIIKEVINIVKNINEARREQLEEELNKKYSLEEDKEE